MGLCDVCSLDTGTKRKLPHTIGVEIEFVLEDFGECLDGRVSSGDLREQALYTPFRLYGIVSTQVRSCPDGGTTGPLPAGTTGTAYPSSLLEVTLHLSAVRYISRSAGLGCKAANSGE